VKGTSEEIEYETVQVKVPKAVMVFLRDVLRDEREVKEYLEYSIIDSVRADIDNGNVFYEPNDVIKRYGLDKVFNDC